MSDRSINFACVHVYLLGIVVSTDMWHSIGSREPLCSS